MWGEGWGGQGTVSTDCAEANAAIIHKASINTVQLVDISAICLSLSHCLGLVKWQLLLFYNAMEKDEVKKKKKEKKRLKIISRQQNFKNYVITKVK